jgi:error-prone DNA polymerase
VNSYGYIELHARSAFSFLRGSAQPEAVVARAAEVDMPALALCDRDGVYGSARAEHAAKEHGPRAIVGSEVTMEDGSVLPLLVESRTGYRNLCQMLTRAKLRAPKGESRVEWEEMEGFAEGLVCLSGDAEGPLHRALRRGRAGLADAEEALRRLERIFGNDRVHIELQRHRVRGEDWINARLVELAAFHRLPMLATNGPAYVARDGRALCDAFTCLRHHVPLDQAGSLLAPNGQRYLKGEPEMRTLFADLPEALDHSLHLAERLEFSLRDLGYRFPEYPVPSGESMETVLRRETYRGARGRYGRITAKIRAQLDHELALIGKLGFSGYFLIVWDIVNFARDVNILIQGRGSAANSAVCYSLGITACDPIGGKLLFERFLSEGRNGWPDIDLDLPSGERRESVIQEVYRRFAPHGAAMTANVITYRGRSAMREMGKVLGLPEDVLGRFSDLYASGDFPHTLELQEQVGKAGLSKEHPRLPALLSLYQNVYGLPRHLGQHSGGMIICDTGLDSFVPLENASMPGRVVVQWDKDDCEDLGIIKVDLLGLGMMAAIQDTLELCRMRGNGREFDLANLPMDDPATFEMMQKADTIGVFQIESRAQMATLPRMKPVCFYDVVVEVALIRPGPIVGNLVHPYLNRRSGKEKIDYIDPRFKDVLDRTLGVPLFQEQVLKMAMIIADFSGSEAEELRRAMSFHRSEERMQKVMGKLRAAMDARAVERAVQDKVCEAICSFALYGFPESHAISFALLAYASVWMKAHRPVEFYAALLNNQPMGFYSPATLVRDAKEHGLRVRPVSVIDSDVACTVESDHILRLGLRMVRELSRKSAERLVAEREAGGMWESLDDFLLRARLRKDERRVLAKIGALNGLGLAEHRRDALWNVEQFVDEEDLFVRARRLSACAAEEEIPYTVRPESPPVVLRPMNPAERLQADYEGLGLSTGPHPVALLRPALRAEGIAAAADLARGRHDTFLTIAGLVICRQRPGTAKGHMFISLEDETGIANAFVPSKTFERYRLVITQERFLRIDGRLQHVDDVISVYALRVEPLPYEAAVLQTTSHDFH